MARRETGGTPVLLGADPGLNGFRVSWWDGSPRAHRGQTPGRACTGSRGVISYNCTSLLGLTSMRLKPWAP